MERAIPIFPAEDLAIAKAFYVNGLGFRVTFEAAVRDGRTGLLGLERGIIQLTIDSPMDGHGRNACVSLQVDDADAITVSEARSGAHVRSTCWIRPAAPSSHGISSWKNQD